MSHYKHAIITNLPANPKEIFDYALSKSYDFWVDEKGTSENPGIFQRKPSNLSYEEAFSIIQANKPHWVVSFRNVNHISIKERDYWEFGGCNIGRNDYGEVFIWIIVEPEEALKIFEKFNLEINEY
jgi:hypothetical protein